MRVTSGSHTITVEDANDCTTSTSVILTEPVAVAITQEPVDASGLIGKSIILTVAAVGENVTYQWQKDGTPINAATEATYRIPAARPTDSGVYSVVVQGCSHRYLRRRVTVRVDDTVAPTIECPSRDCPIRGS